MQQRYRLGIDLGGTKIEGVVLNTEGVIERRERIDTPKDDYSGIINAICKLTNQLSDDSAIPLGIGTPGSVSKTSPLMRNSNSTCLNGKPFFQDLQSALDRPLRMANDADCFALSEALDGAGANYDSVFGVILGTGVGGGLVYRGQLITGVNGIAGEWGHNPVPFETPEDRACFCGKKNCVETWLAGPAMEKTYEQTTGDALRAVEIAERAAAGNVECRDALDLYSQRLAAALAVVINIVDPDAVVLGGGLSNIPQLYDLVPDYLPHCVFSDHTSTKVLQAQHGDSSGVRGAAWLWPD